MIRLGRFDRLFYVSCGDSFLAWLRIPIWLIIVRKYYSLSTTDLYSLRRSKSL